MTYSRVSLKAVQQAYLQQQSTLCLNSAVSDFYAFFSAITHTNKRTHDKAQGADSQRHNNTHELTVTE